MSVYVTGDTHGGFQRLGMKYFHGNGRDNHGQSFLLGHIRPVGWKGGHRHIKTP